MDIQELTHKMHQFVSAKGWYQPDTPKPQTLRNLAISLALEASEVLEHFQWQEEGIDPEGLSGELADVALYLLQISSLAGIDLEAAILQKLTLNYQRNWDGEDNPDRTYNRPNLKSRGDLERHPQENNDEPTTQQPQPSQPFCESPFLAVRSPNRVNPSIRMPIVWEPCLGEAGYTVLTGGYIGTMEAVSRGAAEAGGHVIGVTCDEIESWRPVAPNPWVMEENRFPTLNLRLNALIQDCDAALALPGGIGTLAEIAMMWSQLQTGASHAKPLILIGPGWQATLHSFYIAQGAYVADKDRRWVRFASDVENAFRDLQAALSAFESR